MAPASDIERTELPSLERLGLSAPPEVCPAVVAQTWFETSVTNIQANDVEVS